MYLFTDFNPSYPSFLHFLLLLRWELSFLLSFVAASYVIDYYHDDNGVDADGAPSLHDTQSVRSIVVDVRPALDTPHALFNRVVKMPLASVLAPDQPLDDFMHLPLTQPRDRPGAHKYGPADDGGSEAGWGKKLAATVASWGIMPRADTTDGQRLTPNGSMAKVAAQARAAGTEAEKTTAALEQGRLWKEPGLPPDLAAVRE